MRGADEDVQVWTHRTKSSRSARLWRNGKCDRSLSALALHPKITPTGNSRSNFYIAFGVIDADLRE